MKLMRYISKLMSILACMHLWSCDVHEFPYPLEEDSNTSFILHLDYDTNLPYYKTIECTEDARSVESQKFDVRYIVKVYPEASDENSKELHSFVFTKDDVTSLNHSVTMNLKQGHYKFMVWTDYIMEGSDVDLFYNAKVFNNIALKEGETYQGNSDEKDAFRGIVVSEVSSKVTEARVTMERPVAKFKFISTDMDKFMSQFDPTTTINDFKVVFRYQGYLPNAYNMHTNQSTSSISEKSFESKLTKISETEVQLGFDYVFAEVIGSSVYVTVEIRNKDENVLSSFTTIEVPLIRGKLTTVKAKFMSSQSGGGAGIDPDYNGDINIEI